MEGIVTNVGTDVVEILTPAGDIVIIPFTAVITVATEEYEGNIVSFAEVLSKYNGREIEVYATNLFLEGTLLSVGTESFDMEA